MAMQTRLYKLLVVAMLALCLGTSAPAADVVDTIIVDQFGWRADASNKVAVFSNPITGQNAATTYVPGTNFQVRRVSDDSVVFTGPTAAWNGGATHAQSGDQVWWGDFSALRTPGEYCIYDPSNDVQSVNFEIRNDIFNSVLNCSVRTFYYQRCGTEITAGHGGNWCHAVCHTQDLQATLWTTSDQGNPRDVSGGWHDAGDYNKYVPFTLNTMWHMMMAYELAPSAYGDDTNIPESGNRVPDILDEIKWELDWLLKMQHTDGSVFNRVAVRSYGSGYPQDDALQRYYTQPTTWATATAAALWAHGARVFACFAAQYPGYADMLTGAASNAWLYLESVPDMYPVDGTDGASMAAAAGGSDSNDDKRRRVLAAAELYAATGITKYRTYFDGMVTNIAATSDNGNHPLDGEWPSMLPDGAWALNAALIVYAGTTYPTDSAIVNKAKFSMQNGADWYPTSAYNDASDAYRAYMWDGHYCWGSNHNKALWAMLPIYAIYLDVDPSRNALYRAVAAEYVHYFHGRNPLALCHLSNMGTNGASLGGDKCMMEPYHQWFADGSPLYDGAGSTYGPGPGFLAGGADYFFTKSFVAPPYGEPHQKAFKDWNTGWNASQGDNENSWEITEPAIYYQAAYTLVLGYFCDPTSDTDFDRMADKWEVLHFGNTGASDGALTEDWDEDGFCDLHEFLAGTIPTNPASLLEMSDVRRQVSGEKLVIDWQSASNRTYAIQMSTNLLDGFTQTVTNGIPADPPENCQTVTVDSAAHGFFRVVVE